MMERITQRINVVKVKINKRTKKEYLKDQLGDEFNSEQDIIK